MRRLYSAEKVRRFGRPARGPSGVATDPSCPLWAAITSAIVIVTSGKSCLALLELDAQRFTGSSCLTRVWQRGVPPPDSSYWSYGHRPLDRDFPSTRDSFPDRSRGRPQESNEGIGWPKDKPDAKPDTRSDAEKVKDLQSELDKVKRENDRLTDSYNRSLQELKRKDNELSGVRRELDETRRDRSRLIDTNANLVRDNMALRKKSESSPDIRKSAAGDAAQDAAVEKQPKRKNWFPTDKVAAAGGAVAGVAGTYAVMVGRVSSKEEAFGVACAGAGMTTLALGREITDKINDWRNKRAEKKDADR